MNTIKHLVSMLVQPVKWLISLPKSWAEARQNRLMYAVRIKNENQRIARLGRPNIYLSK